MAALPPSDGWITPKAQLGQMLPSLHAGFLQASPLYSDIAWIVAQYLTPSDYTNWYKSLEKINCLSLKIPLLPQKMDAILEEECPIFGPGKQVRDTHFLVLIPKESGTLNKLNECRARLLGITPAVNLAPLGDLGDKPFDSEWALITRDVLPESLGKSYDKQAKMVEKLKNYTIPTVQKMGAALLLHEIGTGERLYDVMEGQNFTVLQEETQIEHEEPTTLFSGFFSSTTSAHLTMKSSEDHGISVSNTHFLDGDLKGRIGVAAMRVL